MLSNVHNTRIHKFMQIICGQLKWKYNEKYAQNVILIRTQDQKSMEVIALGNEQPLKVSDESV